ncbi:hypothetical protein SBA6_630002 [Candidatus Sulfopaludibacter sp. SbA6]|nr:hypothetical protein SBA6_630002 [Candidatus Sulfopaludibacter sp. SbA6]
MSIGLLTPSVLSQLDHEIRCYCNRSGSDGFCSAGNAGGLAAGSPPRIFKGLCMFFRECACQARGAGNLACSRRSGGPP